MRKRIVVVYGGQGSEREVSIGTGKNILKNLDKGKFEGVGLEMPKTGGSLIWLQQLVGLKPDVVFLGLHGKDGEDGRIQATLETLGIKYTGSGVLASAIGMDKRVFKQLMRSAGMLMPESMSETVHKFPCVVKPADQGSSVGVSVVEGPGELLAAVKKAQEYSSEVLVEKFIKGTEVSCGVWGNKTAEALPLIEIVPKLSRIFDYQSKYTKGGSEEIVPARISKLATKRVQEAAVTAYQTVGCRGYGRVDFIVKDEQPYLLEINTLPGMTETSLLPQEAAAAGISYRELLTRIIELAGE